MAERVKESRKRKNRLRPVTLAGIEFTDSYNAARYEILAKRLAAGKIKDLEVRPPYYLFMKQPHPPWEYRPSFEYWQIDEAGRARTCVVEDIQPDAIAKDPRSKLELALLMDQYFGPYRIGVELHVLSRSGLQLSADRKRAYRNRVKARKIEAAEDEEAAMRAHIEAEIGGPLPDAFKL
jgi:hypothetical protein